MLWKCIRNVKQIKMKKTNDKNADAFKMDGNWPSQSKQLKSKYPQLTDTDLKVESGKEDEMLGRVENRLKKNREEVINIIQKEQQNNENSNNEQSKDERSKKEQSKQGRSKEEQSINDQPNNDRSKRD